MPRFPCNTHDTPFMMLGSNPLHALSDLKLNKPSFYKNSFCRELHLLISKMHKNSELVDLKIEKQNLIFPNLSGFRNMCATLATLCCYIPYLRTMRRGSTEYGTSHDIDYGQSLIRNNEFDPYILNGIEEDYQINLLPSYEISRCLIGQRAVNKY